MSSSEQNSQDRLLSDRFEPNSYSPLFFQVKENEFSAEQSADPLFTASSSFQTEPKTILPPRIGGALS